MQATLERLRQRRDERGEEGGFTLIELLIVVVILGILAAIVVFAVQNFTGTSAQSSCKTDYKSVETAAEAFKANTGNYPASIADLTTATPPYLKDAPTNGSHYAITTAGGVVTVTAPTPGGTVTNDITGCNAVS